MADYQNRPAKQKSSHVFQKVKREQMQENPLILIQDNMNCSRSGSTSNICSSAKRRNQPSHVQTIRDENSCAGDANPQCNSTQNTTTQAKAELCATLGSTAFNSCLNLTQPANLANKDFASHALTNSRDMSSLQNLSNMLDQCLEQTRSLIQENEKGVGPLQLKETASRFPFRASVKCSSRVLPFAPPEWKQQAVTTTFVHAAGTGLLMSSSDVKRPQALAGQQKVQIPVINHLQQTQQIFMTLNQQVSSRSTVNGALQLNVKKIEKKEQPRKEGE